jgi:hypothetical protein
MYKLDDNGYRVINMDHIMEKYVYSVDNKNRFKNEKSQKAIFENLNPATNNALSLIRAKTCSLGFINFKSAKLIA